MTHKYHNYITGKTVKLKIGDRLSYLHVIQKGKDVGTYTGLGIDGQGYVQMDDTGKPRVIGLNIHKWTKL